MTSEQWWLLTLGVTYLLLFNNLARKFEASSKREQESLEIIRGIAEKLKDSCNEGDRTDEWNRLDSGTTGAGTGGSLRGSGNTAGLGTSEGGGD